MRGTRMSVSAILAYIVLYCHSTASAQTNSCGGSSSVFSGLTTTAISLVVASHHDRQVDAPADAERVENELRPEVEKILDQWIGSPSLNYPMTLKYSRSEFNLTFKSESVTKCVCLIDSNDRWMIRESKVVLPKRALSQRKDKDGHPYSLESDYSFTLTWIDGTLLWTNDDDKTYQKEETTEKKHLQELGLQRPPHQEILNPAELKRRFRFTVSSETEDEIQILGILRMKGLEEPKPFDWYSAFRLDIGERYFGRCSNSQKVSLTIEKSTCLPKRIRTLTDGVEALFIFEVIEFNSPGAKIDEWYRDEGKGWTELQGYKNISSSQ